MTTSPKPPAVSGPTIVGPVRLAPVLTPHGHLILQETDDAAALESELARRLMREFTRSVGHGLLQMGASEVGTALPAALAYWRDFAARYIAAACGVPQDDRRRARVAVLESVELAELVLAVPPMRGAEYASPQVLAALWDELAQVFESELVRSKLPLQEFLNARHAAWNVVGRVHFHLAENRGDSEAPFAFMATYTSRLGAQAKPQHRPLGEALREYAGAVHRERLLSLLVPVQRASAARDWVRELVDSGELYHPLRWSAAQAYAMIQSIPELESAGVVVRVPAAWRTRRPPRPQVVARIGGRAPSGLGADALMDFELSVAVEGEPLSKAEIESLLAASDGLVLLRGQWVQLSRDELARMLVEFKKIERLAALEGLTFAKAMQLLAGAGVGSDNASELPSTEVARVVAGPWLEETLTRLRSPEGLAEVDPGSALCTPLRPYQQTGLRWLHLLTELGLGACLADDMGLGKTIQVLALLLVGKARRRASKSASLLVAPASLLANWCSEIERFAPSLRVVVAHSAFTPVGELERAVAGGLSDTDLVITSYGSLLRMPWLTTQHWRLAILDEAQAIKNPAARQTRAVKQLRASARVALTGTPVENRLGDLWSIFDFLNPGLLGTANEFTLFAKKLAARSENPYRPLRELVKPYILRRLKTDKSVISDLPDKVEMNAWCALSRRQAALYAESVRALEAGLGAADGMKRRGLVLAFLTRFKQICNHPSQWLGDGGWQEAESGKLVRLREVAETADARQEKLLVFTQFREATEPVAQFLGAVLGRAGLVLHGGTPVARRRDLVRRFQDDETVPFMVLSLKAGGTGLNLTAASHVVHFDRWWNPAVEDQATDRAFRIGQTRKVLVHKFVCRGTLEERIDDLINSKRQLTRELFEGGAEQRLTEMSDRELMALVTLDHRSAAMEA